MQQQGQLLLSSSSSSSSAAAASSSWLVFVSYNHNKKISLRFTSNCIAAAQ
jgi:hypothetical protein